MVALKRVIAFADTFSSAINVNGSAYDELKALINDRPLSEITDEEIDANFEGTLSSESRVVLKDILTVTEELIPLMRTRMLTIDPTILAALSKLTG